ncbi:hypothetical protein D3C80_1480200 [compost metagenome]
MVAHSQGFAGFQGGSAALGRDGDQRCTAGGQIACHLLVFAERYIAERAPQAAVKHQYQRTACQQGTQVHGLAIGILQHGQRGGVAGFERVVLRMPCDKGLQRGAKFFQYLGGQLGHLLFDGVEFCLE